MVSEEFEDKNEAVSVADACDGEDAVVRKVERSRRKMFSTKII